MFILAEKVCMVTGGASGIGLSCVKEFLKNGVKAVAVVDVNEQAGLQLLDEIKDEHDDNKAIFINADTTNKTQFENAFKKTIEHFGYIDVLVNNAGIFDDHQWERTVDVNLNGLINGNLLGFEKYIPKYKKDDEGVIINICSIASMSVRGSHPIYTATKHAALGLSRSFGIKEHYDRNKVKVISVCPGITNTCLLPKASTSTHCINEHYANIFRRQVSQSIKQSTTHVAESIMKIIQNATTGSVWVVENEEVAYELEFPSRQEMRKKCKDEKTIAK